MDLINPRRIMAKGAIVALNAMTANKRKTHKKPF
jgi:hypothetical protein